MKEQNKKEPEEEFYDSNIFEAVQTNEGILIKKMEKKK